MKYEEAVRLNKAGQLPRMVKTEKGWYVPTEPAVESAPVKRGPGRPKKNA